MLLLCLDTMCRYQCNIVVSIEQALEECNVGLKEFLPPVEVIRLFFVVSRTPHRFVCSHVVTYSLFGAKLQDVVPVFKGSFVYMSFVSLCTH